MFVVVVFILSTHNPLYSNSVRSNLIVGPEDIIPELQLFKQAGGQTVVDISCTSVRKNSLELPKISRETGVNIIAGTGNYLDCFVTEDTKQMTVQEARKKLKSYCIKLIVLFQNKFMWNCMSVLILNYIYLWFHCISIQEYKHYKN